MFGLSAKVKVLRIIQTDEQDLRCKVFRAKSVKSIPIFQHTKNRKIRPHHEKLRCSTECACVLRDRRESQLLVLLASRSSPVRPRTGQEIIKWKQELHVRPLPREAARLLGHSDASALLPKASVTAVPRGQAGPVTSVV